jgi:tripartite-type tricarboxylate transporter receptor subunit TctC
MRRGRLRQNSYWITLAAAVAATPSQAPAQNAGADFYRGKTITISVGFSAGGGYDLHARTLARVLGRHIPGNPAVVVKNVPGAGGLILMNGLSNTMTKDGTEFATFDRGMALEPLLDPEKARYDSRKLNWIGSTDNDASTCFAWHTASVKTFDDLLQRELIVSGTGTAGDAVLFPRLLNDVLQTKFKVITGYPGSTESLLAMERGETHGFCSMGFVTPEVTRRQWVKEKKVNVLVQLALQKNKDHLDVPLALDYAKTTPDRQAIEFAVSPNLFARPFAAPPGMPAERVKMLRQAFNDTMADADYLADAAGRGMHVQLVTGEEIETVLKRIYAIPEPVIERVKRAVK